MSELYRLSAVLKPLAVLALIGTPLLLGEKPLPRALEGVDVEEQIGAQIDTQLMFLSAEGHRMRLAEILARNRPVILNLVYYTCPMLCNLVLDGQTAALRQVPWSSGREFEIVTISIDAAESPARALKTKQRYLERYGRPAAQWHFLTDHQGSARRLARQVGFHYRYDPEQKQFAHAAAILFLTPDGRVSRYLYGARFRPRDVRLALTEASLGRLGTAGDRFLMFCFHYDPEARAYVPFAMSLMRLAGASVVLIVAITLTRLFLRERALAAQHSTAGKH